jgi:DNA polymerase-4
VPDAGVRSISHEETFAEDRHHLAELRPEVVRLSDAVAGRLRAQGLRGRTVQLKLRYGDFTTVTRSRTLEVATDRGTDLVAEVWELLSRLPVERGVRLVGVGVSNLTGEEPARQLTLDDALSGTDRAAGWDAANRAVDEVRSRFGGGVIGPARLAGAGPADGGGGLSHEPGRQQWGPDAGTSPEKRPRDGAEGDAPR